MNSKPVLEMLARNRLVFFASPMPDNGSLSEGSSFETISLHRISWIWHRRHEHLVKAGL